MFDGTKLRLITVGQSQDGKAFTFSWLPQRCSARVARRLAKMTETLAFAAGALACLAVCQIPNLDPPFELPVDEFGLLIEDSVCARYELNILREKSNSHATQFSSTSSL